MGQQRAAGRQGARRGRRDQAAALREVRRRCADPTARCIGVDTRPAAVKNFLAYSLTRLGVDHIDIYRPARLDPARADRGHDRRDRRPGEGGLRAPHRPVRGRRRDDPPRGRACTRSCDLQIEYSLVSRGPEATIFPALAELGIATTPYGVLSRGLLTGSRPGGAGDFRAHLPRFTRRERREEPAPRRRAGPPRRGPRASRRPSSRSPGCARRAPLRGDDRPDHRRPHPRAARRRAGRPRRRAQRRRGRARSRRRCPPPRWRARATPRRRWPRSTASGDQPAIP